MRSRALRAGLCALLAGATVGFTGHALAQTDGWPHPDKNFSSHGLAANCVMSPEGPRLFVKGEFDIGAAQRITAAFDKCIDRGDGRTIQVWLWSPGGMVDEGIALGNHFAEAGDRVTTYVPAGKACVSICTVSFLGGASRQRFIHPAAQYVVHAFGSRNWSQAYANEALATTQRAQEFVRCFDAADNKGGCANVSAPEGAANMAIGKLMGQLNERLQPVRPLARVCNHPQMVELYKMLNVPDAENLAKMPCAMQLTVTANTLQSLALEFQRNSAQTTRQLYQYLTFPPKGVHVERLLDRWFSVTVNNLVPLTPTEIASIGVAGILDLESPTRPR